MKFKVNISKKMALQIALFVAVIGVAKLFDIYFETNPVKLDNIQKETDKNTDEHGTIYLFSQANPVNAKTSVQKTSDRKLFNQRHDKFLRKYHQTRNYQVLKADKQKPKTPLFLSYHYLVFRNYFFTVPDDEPPLS